MDAKCSKCEGVLDREGSPAYCKKCWAEYQRNYRNTKEGMADAKGFARGVEAMRNALAASAADMGSGSMTGYEIATVIRLAPGPPRD